VRPIILAEDVLFSSLELPGVNLQINARSSPVYVRITMIIVAGAFAITDIAGAKRLPHVLWYLRALTSMTIVEISHRSSLEHLGARPLSNAQLFLLTVQITTMTVVIVSARLGKPGALPKRIVSMFQNVAERVMAAEIASLYGLAFRGVWLRMHALSFHQNVLAITMDAADADVTLAILGVQKEKNA